MLQDYLLFQAKDIRYAIRTSCIMEICKTDKIRNLPNQKKPLLGVSHLRGKFLSIFDVNSLLNVQDNPQKREYTLVVKAVKNERNSLVGICVDQVITMLHQQDKAIMPAPDLTKNFRHVLHHENKNYWIIENTTLLNAVGAELAAA